MKVLHTDKAPAAVGPYSQGLASGDIVFVSGQIPVDPATGNIADDIADQAEQCISNISNILAENGLGLKDVIKTTVLLTDLADFDAVNKRYGELFADPYPARSCFEVSALPKGCQIEIEAIAVKGHDGE
ncbi:MAG: RidA family protein [Anaerovoracaceae bacterium]|nr:RidA family protein [Bacillota bacterium]MDY2669952.1 RidA family protein [Anaerovoracaceae bacterium]